MADSLPTDESYTERRQLFKNVWHTSVNNNEIEDMVKPKVIRTLKLDEIDRCTMGKKKKQRLKSLKTVCNKILDFCDKPNDDIFYEQMAIEGTKVTPPLIKKKGRAKRKMKKSKSLRNRTGPKDESNSVDTNLSEVEKPTLHSAEESNVTNKDRRKVKLRSSDSTKPLYAVGPPDVRHIIPRVRTRIYPEKQLIPLFKITIV